MQIKEAGLQVYHSVNYPSYGHSVEYLLESDKEYLEG